MSNFIVSKELRNVVDEASLLANPENSKDLDCVSIAFQGCDQTYNVESIRTRREKTIIKFNCHLDDDIFNRHQYLSMINLVSKVVKFEKDTLPAEFYTFNFDRQNKKVSYKITVDSGQFWKGVENGRY